MSVHVIRLFWVVATAIPAACTTAPPGQIPVELVDEGIYRIAIVGGTNAGTTRREVSAEWDRAARGACNGAGYGVLEDHDTAQSGETVGFNVFGLPVAPGGTKTVNTKAGFIRCDDSPYSLADASFIIRDIKAVLPAPENLAHCEGVSETDVAALRTRAAALLAGHDVVSAFACFYRAASFGKNFRDGDAEAQFQLARLYERGEGTAASPMRALTWYRRAAVNGHAAAAFRVSELAPTEPVR